MKTLYLHCNYGSERKSGAVFKAVSSENEGFPDYFQR